MVECSPCGVTWFGTCGSRLYLRAGMRPYDAGRFRAARPLPCSLSGSCAGCGPPPVTGGPSPYASGPRNRMNATGKTVLLVEDNEDNRIVYSTILRHFGYRVTEALNGEEGIAKARSEDRKSTRLNSSHA